jgi:tetratricopeptide (TPR) repeat protein
LPDDYESARLAYPVLYVLYGDQVRGYLAETVHVVDRLSEAGVIPRLIVVGIANVERYRDLSPVGRRGRPSGIDKFIEFVRDEMLPFIESEYRTKSYRILIGPQAGAEFGMYVLTEGLELFDAYLLNNPFEGPYAADLSDKADEFLSRDLPSYTFLQITCIDRHLHGELTEAVNAARRFEQAALDRNTRNLDLNMIYVENNEDFIPSPRPKDGLKKLFTDYVFPAERSVEKLSDFTSYYDRLSERFGFDVGFPEQTLYFRADGLARAGKVDNAIEMLNYLVEWNPRSLNAFWCLANTHREVGDRAKAIKYYRKCLEIMPSMAPAREWLQKLSAD